MIAFDSITMVLLVEAFAVLALWLIVSLVLSKKKSVNEAEAAHELIDKLEDTEKIKIKKLGGMIAENCQISETELNDVLEEIIQGEKVLYQNIIQMFLNKDIILLREIDQHIDNISEPYCKMLRQSSDNSANSEELEAAENRIQQLMQNNKKLSEQLNMSLSTMDDISAEYTRVFSGTQTELELENSSKTMLNIFRSAQQQVKKSVSELNMDKI